MDRHPSPAQPAPAAGLCGHHVPSWEVAPGRAGYLLASEITLLVASASCWHLIFSAVAFSNADVRLLRLALSSWQDKWGGRG